MLALEIDVSEKKSKKPRGRPIAKEPNAFGLWIVSSGKSREDVALELSVSAPYLNHLIHSNRRPSLSLALKIRDLTQGTIQPEFWQNIARKSN